VFSIVSARERRRWWATMPSQVLGLAPALDTLAGTRLTTLDLPRLKPMPGWQSLAIVGYAMVSRLVLNDAIKVTLLERWGPSARLDRCCDGVRVLNGAPFRLGIPSVAWTRRSAPRRVSPGGGTDAGPNMRACRWPRTMGHAT